MISIDISEYGDPLYSREASCAVQRLFEAVATTLGISMLIRSPTCNRFSSFHCKESIGAQGISAMRDPQLTAELAAHANMTIP